MSKIAEKKALEAYQKDKLTAVEAVNRAKRFGYIQGYDQAVKDFLEKACEYLYKRQIVDLEVPNIEKFIEDFKNHMQDEMYRLL
jgi:hypothetical protein